MDVDRHAVYKYKDSIGEWLFLFRKEYKPGQGCPSHDVSFWVLAVSGIAGEMHARHDSSFAEKCFYRVPARKLKQLQKMDPRDLPGYLGWEWTGNRFAGIIKDFPCQ